MTVDLSFLQATSDTSNLSEYTFSSQNLGAAALYRTIAVGICARRSAAGDNLVNNVSVGGLDAGHILQVANPVADISNLTALAICPAPLGTTGDVVVTFNTGQLRCRIQLYRLIGIDSMTPSDSDTSIANDPTGTIDIPAGGAAIGIAAATSGSVATWSGLTEDNEATVESAILATCASGEFAAQQSNHVITCDFTATSGSLGVFAAFAPLSTPSGGGRRPRLVTVC